MRVHVPVMMMRVTVEYVHAQEAEVVPPVSKLRADLHTT